MRPARLARAPIAGELPAILTIAAMVIFFVWVAWARTAGPGTQTHVAARVVRLTPAPVSKLGPVSTLVEVEFADGKQTSLEAPYAFVRDCKVGNSVTIVSVPANVGQPELQVDPGTCR